MASPTRSIPRSARGKTRRRALRLAFDVIAVTVWLSLLTGYAESLYWLGKQEILGSLVSKHPGFFWMSPLSQLAYFAVPGVILALLARLTRRWDVLALSVTVLSLLAGSTCCFWCPACKHWHG